MEEPTLEYMPAQDIPKTGADMRASAGPIKRGYKVGYSSTANTTKTQPLVKASKRKREEADTVDGMDIDGAADVDFGPPDTKKRNVVSRDVSGVASTKSWKTPVKARHSASKSIASAKTWDKKVRACAPERRANTKRRRRAAKCRPRSGHLRTHYTLILQSSVRIDD